MADEHDAIVIGMGVGGEEVAGRLADGGLDVLAIERKLVGGECPYWGCIPSKVMVRAGNSLAEAARVIGLAGETKIDPDWAPVAKRVRDVTADWNDETAVERHEKKGETFVRGDARVVGPKAVEVDGRRFTARRAVVIATGGEPGAPPIEGLDAVDYWTNREAIEATELPQSMVVLGAGAVGLELAQTFHRFGTDITIVEVADHALPMEEPENGNALGEVLRAEGMILRTGTSAQRVKQEQGGVQVDLSDGTTVNADKLLVATGRKSNLASLGIDAVDLDSEARSIEVDDHLRAGDGIWAVGDVTGKGAFTHLAVYQGRIAAAHIMGSDHVPADYSAIPRVTFTDPEVASVGLSEAQAKEKEMKIRTGVATTSSSARGWIHGPGAEHGVTKVVADADRGVLVGASTMGPAAGEVIAVLVLAIRYSIPISDLRNLIYPYPTFVRGIEDALREAAG
ncbi:MAG: NAD(P)/FAD-dependent oxidoreductase [Actinomycetota bacterium]|nr:NAD(P)/FAD-dependent oxidoreductase [Actinomycetota bacterium]